MQVVLNLKSCQLLIIIKVRRSFTRLYGAKTCQYTAKLDAMQHFCQQQKMAQRGYNDIIFK